jgi:hypothetical protein
MNIQDQYRQRALMTPIPEYTAISQVQNVFSISLVRTSR